MPTRKEYSLIFALNTQLNGALGADARVEPIGELGKG